MTGVTRIAGLEIVEWGPGLYFVVDVSLRQSGASKPVDVAACKRRARSILAQPTSSAPRDSGKLISRADALAWLLNSLKGSRKADYSWTLLDSALVSKRMEEEGLQPLRGKAAHRLFLEAGFVLLGPVTISGRTRKFWSVTPELFRDRQGKTSGTLVRDHVTL